MKIDFQTITGNKMGRELESTGMDSRSSFEPGTGKTDSVGGNAYVAQLDFSIFSNNAYAQHTRTAENISEMAQNTDVWMQHNYMALLSNTMSEEDYGKALEDGFDIKNMDSTETVTILDKIKGALLEGGVSVAGFNDDLSIDKLAKITGSRSFANALQKSFHENDIPVTSDNVREAKVAYEEVADIQRLDTDAEKYLIQNGMTPTIENIYLASHSTNGTSISGRGFYAQDTDGYFAMKSEVYDWEQLDPQIDKVIEEAGLSENDESVREEARWIVREGIPLTAESLQRLNEIRSISFPISEELGAKAIAAAIADGRKPRSASLADPRSNFEKAAQINEDTGRITEDDIRTAVQQGKELNLKNLIGENRLNTNETLRVSECAIENSDSRVVEARLQLEEVRLRMTVEANRQLLSSGFSIDTAPMQDLIDKLKTILGQMGDESAGAALDEIAEVTPASRSYIFTATLSKVSIIANGPVDITGAMGDGLSTATLSEISDTSKRMSLRYEQAGKEYETMMTKPRSDLGDNIKKAFGNVDEILQEMDIEITEDNRRAVRILGYNSMEINEENLERVRSWDQMLKATLDRMKPGAVLELIRDGKNPLGMTIEELAEGLDKGFKDGDDGSEGKDHRGDEKYSRFLYKLEHSGEITDAERSSFIGIYRLFHTLKANDYQAIGSVLKTGEDMTLGNLIKATRTQKSAGRGMEYTVDDSFGGLGAKEASTSLKIDEQIQMAFRFYSAKADIVYENLEPEKLKSANPDESTLLPGLADKLQDAGNNDELTREYYAQETRHIRDIASGKEAEPAFEELKSVDIATSFSNLEAMISNRRARRTEGIWKDLKEEQTVLVDALDEEGYEDVYRNTLSNLSDRMQEVLFDRENSYLDVRAITLMQKQLSVMSMSSERGSFDVPVEIEGQKISMHITLKSDESMDSRMEASIQTYEYGLITATLYEKSGMINGMLTTTNGKSPEETEYLESVRTKMCVKLAEKLKDVGVGQDTIAILYHTQTQPTSVGKTNATATDGNTKKITETSRLLAMAKAFIEAL
ncbi:MAG: DUF6240 domain-containing protein [Butyrivibrio sp.]|nr:DUF6240 domain-containing protein [Butyrivibrio sp.]